MTDLDALATYADTLLHLSARIVATVQDADCTPHDAERLIDEAFILPAPSGVDPAVTLAIILAAQVPLNVPTSQRIGWHADQQRAEQIMRRLRPVAA